MSDRLTRQKSGYYSNGANVWLKTLYMCLQQVRCVIGSATLNIIFTFEFPICLYLFRTPIGLKTCSNQDIMIQIIISCSNLIHVCKVGIGKERKCENLAVVVIPSCCFAEDAYELCKFITHMHGHCSIYFNLLFVEVLAAVVAC